MELESGRGIWEELKSLSRNSRSAFDFVAAVVTQFGLPISEQVAKIHRRFAVRSCDLCPFYSCCHALNRLDSRPMKSTVFRRPQGP